MIFSIRNVFITADFILYGVKKINKNFSDKKLVRSFKQVCKFLKYESRENEN